MGNSPSHCSCARRAPRIEPHRRLATGLLTAAWLAGAGCGHAQPVPAPAPATPPAGTEAADKLLCAPVERGYLRARLQGAIDARIDWSVGTPQCRGGRRPSGDGVRLLYKGSLGDGGRLLIVLGAGPLAAGQDARNVPVNLTVVREGSGQFFATQGDDKCALDQVHQEPLAGAAGQYLLTGRGYCTQPARAVGGEGSVLLSRFDVEAIVDYNE